MHLTPTEFALLRELVTNRAKLETDEDHPLIVTAPRAGYRFVADSSAPTTRAGFPPLSTRQG